MKLKTKLLLFSFLSCSLGLHAQTKIGFSYDEAGNRVKREIVMSQSRSKARKQSASFSDMVSDRQIKISPNPTKGVLRVELLNCKEQITGNIAVYSLSGTKVAYCPIVNNMADVDISSSVSGIYVLRINVGESSSSWKIIKE